MNLVVSGHVNQMMQLRDNGRTSGLIFSGNSASQTRFRFVGTGKLSDDLTARTRIEVGDTSSATSSLDLGANGDDQGTFGIRQMDIRLSSKTMGAFTIGDSSLATDGYHGAGDMSGMAIIQDAGDEGVGASVENFKNSVTGANVQTVGATFNNLDAGRTDHIGYDSPTFAGFKFQTSMSNEDGSNFGLRYGGDFGGVKVKGGIAYDTVRIGANDTDTINGSVGVLLPMGLNFFFSAADRDANGGVDEDRIYARIGYMFNASELGQTRLGLGWGQSDDRVARGDEGERWSIAVVQVVEPLGAEVYAGYHNYSLDKTGVSIDDVDVVTAGMRISF
jgi:hypothetical protein